MSFDQIQIFLWLLLQLQPTLVSIAFIYDYWDLKFMIRCLILESVNFFGKKCHFRDFCTFQVDSYVDECMQPVTSDLKFYSPRRDFVAQSG